MGHFGWLCLTRSIPAGSSGNSSGRRKEADGHQRPWYHPRYHPSFQALCVLSRPCVLSSPLLDLRTSGGREQRAWRLKSGASHVTQLRTGARTGQLPKGGRSRSDRPQAVAPCQRSARRCQQRATGSHAIPTVDSMCNIPFNSKLHTLSMVPLRSRRDHPA